MLVRAIEALGTIEPTRRFERAIEAGNPPGLSDTDRLFGEGLRQRGAHGGGPEIGSGSPRPENDTR